MLITFLNEDFKFCDERGELIQLVHNGYKQVNFITARKGSFRGGHYHKFNTEAFFVISGCFKLELFKNANHQKEVYEINSGDFFCIPPLVVHSFNFIEDTQLISMYSQGVEMSDGTKDILITK